MYRELVRGARKTTDALILWKMFVIVIVIVGIRHAQQLRSKTMQTITKI